MIDLNFLQMFIAFCIPLNVISIVVNVWKSNFLITISNKYVIQHTYWHPLKYTNIISTFQYKEVIVNKISMRVQR